MLVLKLQDWITNILICRKFSQGNAAVVVKKLEMEHVKGSTIDYEYTNAREGFVVSINPQASATCGCKLSFTPTSFTMDSLDSNKE